MDVKVGNYRLVDFSRRHVSYQIGEGADVYDDMVSPADVANLCSSMPIETFVESTWDLNDPKTQDDLDFIEFWRQVRQHMADHP